MIFIETKWDLSTVRDIHEALSVTIWDEDPNKKVDFLGQVAIPLLKVRNCEKRWYLLKDHNLLGPAKGRVLLELELIWNPVGLVSLETWVEDHRTNSDQSSDSDVHPTRDAICLCGAQVQHAATHRERQPPEGLRAECVGL